MYYKTVIIEMFGSKYKLDLGCTPSTPKSELIKRAKTIILGQLEYLGLEEVKNE